MTVVQQQQQERQQQQSAFFYRSVVHRGTHKQRDQKKNAVVVVKVSRKRRCPGTMTKAAALAAALWLAIPVTGAHQTSFHPQQQQQQQQQTRETALPDMPPDDAMATKRQQSSSFSPLSLSTLWSAEPPWDDERFSNPVVDAPPVSQINALWGSHWFLELVSASKTIPAPTGIPAISAKLQQQSRTLSKPPPYSLRSDESFSRRNVRESTSSSVSQPAPAPSKKPSRPIKKPSTASNQYTHPTTTVSNSPSPNEAPLIPLQLHEDTAIPTKAPPAHVVRLSQTTQPTHKPTKILSSPTYVPTMIADFQMAFLSPIPTKQPSVNTKSKPAAPHAHVPTVRPSRSIGAVPTLLPQDFMRQDGTHRPTTELRSASVNNYSPSLFTLQPSLSSSSSSSLEPQSLAPTPTGSTISSSAPPEPSLLVTSSPSFGTPPTPVPFYTTLYPTHIHHDSFAPIPTNTPFSYPVGVPPVPTTLTPTTNSNQRTTFIPTTLHPSTLVPSPRPQSPPTVAPFAQPTTPVPLPVEPMPTVSPTVASKIAPTSTTPLPTFPVFGSTPSPTVSQMPTATLQPSPATSRYLRYTPEPTLSLVSASSYTQVPVGILFRASVLGPPGTTPENIAASVEPLWQPYILSQLQTLYKNVSRQQVILQSVNLTVTPLNDLTQPPRRLSVVAVESSSQASSFSSSSFGVATVLIGDGVALLLAGPGQNPQDVEREGLANLNDIINTNSLQQALMDANSPVTIISNGNAGMVGGGGGGVVNLNAPLSQPSPGNQRKPTVVEAVIGFLLVFLAVLSLCFWAWIFYKKRRKRLRRKRLEKLRKQQSYVAQVPPVVPPATSGASGRTGATGRSSGASGRMVVPSSLHQSRPVPSQRVPDLPQPDRVCTLNSAPDTQSEGSMNSGSENYEGVASSDMDSADMFAQELEHAAVADQEAWEDFQRRKKMLEVESRQYQTSAVVLGYAGPGKLKVYDAPDEGEEGLEVEGFGKSRSLPYGDELRLVETKDDPIHNLRSFPYGDEHEEKNEEGDERRDGIPLTDSDAVQWTPKGVALRMASDQHSDDIVDNINDSEFDLYGDRGKKSMSLEQSWDLDASPIVDPGKPSQYSFMYPLKSQEIDDSAPPNESDGDHSTAQARASPEASSWSSQGGPFGAPRKDFFDFDDDDPYHDFDNVRKSAPQRSSSPLGADLLAARRILDGEPYQSKTMGYSGTKTTSWTKTTGTFPTFETSDDDDDESEGLMTAKMLSEVKRLSQYVRQYEQKKELQRNVQRELDRKTELSTSKLAAASNITALKSVSAPSSNVMAESRSLKLASDSRQVAEAQDETKSKPTTERSVQPSEIDKKSTRDMKRSNEMNNAMEERNPISKRQTDVLNPAPHSAGWSKKPTALTGPSNPQDNSVQDIESVSTINSDDQSQRLGISRYTVQQPPAPKFVKREADDGRGADLLPPRPRVVTPITDTTPKGGETTQRNNPGHGFKPVAKGGITIVKKISGGSQFDLSPAPSEETRTTRSSAPFDEADDAKVATTLPPALVNGKRAGEVSMSHSNREPSPRTRSKNKNFNKIVSMFESKPKTTVVPPGEHVSR